MREFEEVLNAEDANYCVVLSEAFGLKRVLRKIYFYLPPDMGCKHMVAWTAKYYGDLMGPNIRLDIYRVNFGRVIGRY